MRRLLNLVGRVFGPSKQVARDGRRRRHVSPQKRRFLPSLEMLEDRSVPTTFTVVNLADDNAGIGNAGDLRYVINRARAVWR